MDSYLIFAGVDKDFLLNFCEVDSSSSLRYIQESVVSRINCEVQLVYIGNNFEHLMIYENVKKVLLPSPANSPNDVLIKVYHSKPEILTELRNAFITSYAFGSC